MFQLLHSMLQAVFSQQMLLILLFVYLTTAIFMIVPMTWLVVQNVKDEGRVSLGIVLVFLGYTFMPVLNTCMVIYAICGMIGETVEDRLGKFLDKVDAITLFKLKRPDTPMERLRRSTGT